ncbi:MAG TPA: pyridoxal-dependent decarboxylase [Candidatus Solibacter sp.]|nr:pyridoxal-dependent decarboxylase [Candidatus Solibacter sp.]
MPDDLSVVQSPPEKALLTDLSSAIERLLPALETFTKFEGPDPAARRSIWKSQLEETLPETGAGADEVLRILEEVVIPNGLRTGHPGFSGWVTTMPPTVPTAASLAATLSAPQRWWASPGNLLEALALDWLRDLLALSPEHQGVFISGGAVANLICLGAARQSAGERLGFDPSRAGASQLVEPRVYAGANVHHVVTRALAILGLGQHSLAEVSAAADGMMDVSDLEERIRADRAAGATPIAIVASAGDVNTGKIDPLPRLMEAASRHQVWLHVDGAYGAFGVLDERTKPLFGDWSQVDSVAVDPHKWLAAPVGCGAAFVRDRDLLGRTFTLEPADYLSGAAPGEADLGSPFEELGYEFQDFSVDQSSPSRGLVVWALLKEIGAEGMRQRVGRHLDCARQVARRVAAEPDLELLSEPVLSICCFRIRPAGMGDGPDLDAINERVLKAVWARGRTTPSTTRVDGRLAIRPCFINPRTTLADADALVDEVLAVGRAG